MLKIVGLRVRALMLAMFGQNFSRNHLAANLSAKSFITPTLADPLLHDLLVKNTKALKV